MAGKTAQDREAAMVINEMEGVRVTAQVQLSGVAFALETTVYSGEEDAINGMADRFAKIMGRQKAKVDLSEKLVALEVNRQMRADLGAERDKALTDLADEKVRQLAALQASWMASNKRTEFRLTDAQRQQMDSQFGELRIAGIKRQYEERKAQLEQDAPIIQKQVDRLRAIVAGYDPEEEPLQEAAE